MKLSHDRYLAGVRIKARPKKLAQFTALLIWIGEDCVLNIRCNDPQFKFGKFTFDDPPFIPKETEIRGLIQKDGGIKGNVEFALILQPEITQKVLVADAIL